MSQIQQLGLLIHFATVTDLISFAQKMGNDVMNAEIIPAGAPAAPKKRGGKKDVELPAAPSQPAVGNLGGFPGGPTNFAPGAPAMAAPAAPANPTTIAAPQPAAPAPSAPVAPAAPAAPAISEEQQNYINGCIQLVNTLGQVQGLTDAHLTFVMGKAFAQVGLPATSTITGMGLEQIKAFYPILHQHVSAVCNGTYQWQ